MSWFDSIIQGALNGFGSAIGTYLALTHGIKRLSTLKDKIKFFFNGEK